MRKVNGKRVKHRMLHTDMCIHSKTRAQLTYMHKLVCMTDDEK